jgi:hypothetical protein
MRWTLVLVLAALLASGCTGSERQLLSNAMVKMNAQPGMTMRVTVTMSVAGRTMSLAGTAWSDKASGLTQIALDMPIGGRNVHIDEVADNGTLYMRMTGGPPTPRPWVQVTAGGADSGQMAADPSQMLSSLDMVVDSIQQVGREPVNGVATTHYHAVLDTSKASPAAGAQPPTEGGMFRQLGATTLPLDAWIDDSGLLRRMSMSMQTAGSGTVPGMTISVDMVVLSFGAVPGIVVPPTDQVTVMPASGLGGSSATTGYGSQAPGTPAGGYAAAPVQPSSGYTAAGPGSTTSYAPAPAPAYGSPG